MTKPPTDKQLAEMRARCTAAENGWHLVPDEDDVYRFEIHGDGPTHVAVFGGDPDDSMASYPTHENALFAVHARWDVPVLLDEVDRLKVALRRIASACAWGCTDDDCPSAVAKRALGAGQ